MFKFTSPHLRDSCDYGFLFFKTCFTVWHVTIIFLNNLSRTCIICCLLSNTEKNLKILFDPGEGFLLILIVDKIMNRYTRWKAWWHHDKLSSEMTLNKLKQTFDVHCTTESNLRKHIKSECATLGQISPTHNKTKFAKRSYDPNGASNSKMWNFRLNSIRIILNWNFNFQFHFLFSRATYQADAQSRTMENKIFAWQLGLDSIRSLNHVCVQCFKILIKIQMG